MEKAETLGKKVVYIPKEFAEILSALMLKPSAGGVRRLHNYIPKWQGDAVQRFEYVITYRRDYLVEYGGETYLLRRLRRAAPSRWAELRAEVSAAGRLYYVRWQDGGEKYVLVVRDSLGARFPLYAAKSPDGAYVVDLGVGRAVVTPYGYALSATNYAEAGAPQKLYEVFEIVMWDYVGQKVLKKMLRRKFLPFDVEDPNFQRCTMYYHHEVCRSEGVLELRDFDRRRALAIRALGP